MTLRIGSLCSGYGGLEMGVRQVIGGTVAWHVEYDAAPSRILAHHWPDVPNHGDVKTTNWTQVEPVDVLTAGYPCQPFSHAGRRAGADDPRHLWPDVLNAVRVLRPRLALFENVSGHLSLGFDRVLADLAEVGMDARWMVLRAADVGAPHGRARLFIAAQDADRAVGDQRRFAASGQAPGGRARSDTGRSGGVGTAPDSHSAGLERRRIGRESAGECAAWPINSEPLELVEWGSYTATILRWERAVGRPAPRPVEPAPRSGRERLSPRFVEWLMGLPEGHVTAVPGMGRNDQLKALGNGVVPQQAAAAFSLLLDAREAVA